jgi:protein-(glutamine-N5) methyltransferase, release factor-specific
MNDIEYLRKYLKDKDLDTALKELESGIPVQYIVGNTNFYGYDFKVNRNTLIPRFETELLVEKTYNYIKKYFNKDNIKILDIGTGSGCIAITLNKLLNSCDITGIDISSEALEVAKENNISNNTNVKFIESDIFSNVSDKYDVIISNPPYISYDDIEVMDIVKNNEPLLALYAKDNGLYFYDKIIKDSSKYLNDKFIIAFEIGYKQGKDITKIVNKYYKDIKMSVEKDYSGRDRFVFIDNIK